MKKLKKLFFGVTVLFTGSFLGIILLFGVAFYLFGCKHYPQPNVPYSLEFYDENIKKFPETSH